MVLDTRKETMSMIVEAEYLYNDNGWHDKVYNVAIKDTEDDRIYEVWVEYGARLGVLRTLRKDCTNIISARLTFNSLVKEKKAKGYRSVGQSVSPRTSLTNIPLNTLAEYKPKKPAKPKEPEKYNPDALPERRLDWDL